MRIAITHAYGWPEVRRGAERYVHELAAGLSRAGHQVELVIAAETAGRDQVLGVPVQRVKRQWHLQSRYGAVADQVEFGAQAFRRLAARRIDVWHAVSTGDGAAAAMAADLRPGLRSVYTEPGFPSRTSRERRPDHRVYRQIVNRIDEFVCLSEPAGALLRADYGRAARIVPAGVDSTVFAPSGGPEDRSPNPVLLFPSALGESRKNVNLVLEAAARLRERGSAAEVWLVGPGALPTTLTASARAGLDAVAVRRIADPAELPDLYRRAWVTVLPSRAEVFGLVALESLACGTPAVVLDDGLGPAALVVPGTGAKACEAALDLAGRPDTVEACRTRAMDFDWDTAVVPAMLEVYG
jgi:glycosyltransferase involved in cell wall biosynthesis